MADPKAFDLKQHFAEESTIHGMREILTSPTTGGRTFWAFILLSAVSFLSFNFYLIAISCIEEDTVASISRTSVTTFPNMTYCPKDWINPARAEALRIEQSVVEHIYSLFYINYINFDLKSTYNETAAVRLNEILAQQFDGNVNRLVLAIAFEADDLIVRNITWQKITISDTRVTTYGVCATISMVIPLSKIYYPYVQMELFLKRNYEDMPIAFLTGHRFEIGENTLVQLNYIDIHQQMDYNIYVTWQSYKDVNLKRLPCQVGGSEMYAQSCAGTCVGAIATADGYCTQYHPSANMTVDDVRELCSQLKVYETPLFGYSLTLGDQPDKLNDKFKACYEHDCRHPCHYQKYQMSVSSSNSRSSAPLIIVRHDSNVIERTEALTCTPVSLVANVGGVMGLILGSSIISVVQLLWLVCKAVSGKNF